MRTKTLLIAAAALAATIISSEAQTVYSANIVGYVNQPFPASAYSMVVAPLSASTTNNAEEVLTCLQTGDAILTWNGAGYISSVYVGPGTWVDGTSGDTVSAPLLPPGKGFFYQNGQAAAETNTFVGSVVLTNSLTLPVGGYSLLGSTAPIGGSVESTNFSFPFQTGNAILIWNGTGYTSSVYVGPGTWVDGTSGNSIPTPTLTAGEGFFYQNGQGTPEQWNQNVVVQ